MCRSSKLRLSIVVISTCLLMASGCGRNRAAYGPFNSTYGPLAGNTAVAPPATYSLNIPGANNQNYYNGSGTNQQLSQRQATNTLPGASGVNVQNGWQPAGTSSNSTSNSTIQNATSNVSNPVRSNSVLENNRNQAVNQTQLANVNPFQRNNQPNPGNSIAQNNNSNGLSFTDVTNFSTTAVDERLDQTRLPVTDASQVRAPSNFRPTTTVGQFNVPYYVPGQQQVAQNPQQQRFASNVQFQQIPLNTQPNLRTPNPNTIVGTFGQPNFAQPIQQPYSGLQTQNRVLAQSTVYADPRDDPNFQSGWRDRELTAGRDSINR